MGKYIKKLLAPIIITGILILLFIGYFLICVILPGIPMAAKIVGILILLSLCGVSIFVLIERIREVRSGEEDDLSQY